MLVYHDGEESLARETMCAALDLFMENLSIFDAGLSTLMVIDTIAGREDLAVRLPLIEPVTLGEIADQPSLLHTSQCIFALTPDFLRRSISARFVKSTRFYSIVPESQAERVEKVHPLEEAIRLEPAYE